MKKHLHLFFVPALVCGTLLHAQSIPFTNQTSLLPTTSFHSGNGIGVCDMNGDHKDDIVRAENNATQYIETQQQPNALFGESSSMAAIGDPWGMCVGDVNNDGFNDVLWGDYGATRILVWGGSSYTSTNVSSVTSSGFIFVQGCNFFDINNDGNLDAFVCNDVAMSHIYMGNGLGGWTYNNSVEMPLATVPASDNSGNYASIWVDVNNDGYIDLMITHCRQSITNPADARRIDQVFINNGDGTYTQDVTNWTNLRDGAQGWSTAWGDIDNDGDMDAFVLNYDVNSTLMINNGSGVFTDAMAGSGIATTTTFFGENATFHDFDNDGFLDLMISGGGHFLYQGHGDGTFTQVTPNPFSYNGNTITAHAVGDLNSDGFLDIYASYCNIYQSPSNKNDRLWMNDCRNQGNTNHYIVFDLVGGGTPGFSNKTGIGAIVKIYGAFGVQVREIRSGEAYGIQNSFAAHFGLGSGTSIDSVVVWWPSGIVDRMFALSADQHYLVNEGGSSTTANSAYHHPFRMIFGPNPMTDEITINMFNTGAYGLDNIVVEIFDINGKATYRKQGLESSTLVIARGEMSSGLYLLNVRCNGQTLVTEKLIVQ